jgi:ATP-dependent Clp protease ATP-binding subunit ClpA
LNFCDVNNLVPFVLEGRSVVSLDLASCCRSRYRGEFELRFQRVLDEVLAQLLFLLMKFIILEDWFQKHWMQLFLKPVLSRSGFQCIGAQQKKNINELKRILL